MTDLIYPMNYLIVEREGKNWHFQQGKVFYNRRNVPAPERMHDRLSYFELDAWTVINELFRINGGRAGYYIANLRERKYYYCGTTLDEVKAVFIMLGIGKPDPIDPT